MIGRRSFAMYGGLAAIGMLTGKKTSANPLATPQAGDVILFAGGVEVAVAGVLRPLTKAEAAALTGGARGSLGQRLCRFSRYWTRIGL